ncbi:MAG: FtsK/SpoIIIE domain-containing protein [Leucobacter sp.]
MDALLESLLSLLGALLPYVMAMVAITVAGCFGLAWVIRSWTRWRTKTPKHYFSIKNRLLALEAIVLFYSPASRYMSETEKKTASQWAWLSPYYRATKRAIKDNRSASRGKLYDARKHISDTAKRIHVGPVPDDAFIVGDDSKHFRIDFDLDGHDKSEFQKMEGKIKAQLGLHSIEEYETRDNYTQSYIAHLTEPDDVLVSLGKGAAWLDENPAKDPYSLPIAIKQDGSAWTLPTHHTIVLGETGSGKSSPLHAIIRQLAPFVVDGSVKLHGIDAKAMELAVYKDDVALFENIVFDPVEAGELIAELKHNMEERTRGLKVNRKDRVWTQKIKAAKEHPLNILVIDELWDLFADLDNPSQEALNSIGRKGRAPGFLIIAATQSVEMSVLGNMRKHFINKLCLRQDSASFNDFMLGTGAAERGFDSTLIPPSNEENGNAYAGIGYIKKGPGNPEKVRFAHSTKDDVFDLLDRVEEQKREAEPQSVSTVEAPIFLDDEFANASEGDDGGFEITSTEEEPDDVYGEYGSDFR